MTYIDISIRSESHIDFRTKCVVMTLEGVCVCAGRGGEGGIANDILKKGRVMEFQMNC